MSINNEGTFARMPDNNTSSQDLPEYISPLNPYTTLREDNSQNS